MFNFDMSTNRPEETVVKKGETLIVAYFHWGWPPWKCGYRRKAIKINPDGSIEVKKL